MKANPDAPQLPVRARALGDGKIVYMAVPRLADPLPFMLVDPGDLSEAPRRAASIKGASRHARRVAVEDLPHLDLIVCGSVAVNRSGVRVGKGGGYSDLEFALAAEAGVVDRATTIATTVHPLQLVDGDLPETGHDFRVDLIVTPEDIIRTRAALRPRGIIWADLDDEKIASVPAVAALRARTGPP